MKNKLKQGATGIRSFIESGVSRIEKLSCKLLALGCFTAGTIVHTASGHLPIEQIAIGTIVIAHEKVNQNEVIIDESTGQYSFEGIAKVDYLASDSQRKLDKHGYYGEDLFSLMFEIIDEDSSLTTVNLIRPKYWLLEKEISFRGQKINLSLPEIGVQGLSVITDIKPFVCDSSISQLVVEYGFTKAPVIGTITRNASNLHKLIFEDGQELQVTGSHPMYSLTAGGWTMASDIRVNDKILSWEGIQIVKHTAPLPGEYRVFNLEVGYNHNFLVGKNGIVVHNKCPDAWRELLEKDALLAGVKSKIKNPGLKKLILHPQIERVKEVLGIVSDIVVCFDDFGFPDFLPFVKTYNGVECIVPLDDMNGTNADLTEANTKLVEKLNQAGASIPVGTTFNRSGGYFTGNDQFSYSWHHHQDGKHMMLIPTPIHSKVSHTGGTALAQTVIYKKKLPDPWKTSALWKNHCD